MSASVFVDDESPPDYTAVPTHPFLSPIPIALSGLILTMAVLFLAWLHVSVPPADRVPAPDQGLSLLVGRTMDLEAALVSAPAWERWFYELTSGDRSDAIAEAIVWYRELNAVSDQPTVALHLAILEGEAGQIDQLRDRFGRWTQQAPPFPLFAQVIGAAFLHQPLSLEEEHQLQAELAELLPAGWFYDQVSMRLAEQTGDAASWLRSEASMIDRGRLLLHRMRLLTAMEVGIAVAGLAAAFRIVRLERGALAVGAAPIPPPWRGRAGVAVLIHGGAAGALLVLMFLFLGASEPWIQAAAIPVSSLPLLMIARLRLLEPFGLGFGDGLGLRPLRGTWPRLFLSVLGLTAVGSLGESVLNRLAVSLNVQAHWTEWFDPDLAWGSPDVVATALFEFIVLAPFFEEIVFRGLLYGTLRRRFGPAGSAWFSATLFAAAHGYGLLGFASVVLSGVLWAWMYERTGSLLPGIVAHSLNNLLVCVSVIALLR
jgi:membrane protease YdiL (CAAX protease family)